MSIHDWEVGEEVAVRNSQYGGDLYQAVKINRVLKSFVETDDGKKWNHHGGRYPRQTYSLLHLVPMTPEIEIQVHRQRFLTYLVRVEWKEFNTEHLSQLVGTIFAMKRDEEQNGNPRSY